MRSVWIWRFSLKGDVYFCAHTTRLFCKGVSAASWEKKTPGTFPVPSFQPLCAALSDNEKEGGRKRKGGGRLACMRRSFSFLSFRIFVRAPKLITPSSVILRQSTRRILVGVFIQSNLPKISNPSLARTDAWFGSVLVR